MAQTTKKKTGQSTPAAKKKKPTKKELEQLRLQEEQRALERKAQQKQLAAIGLFFASVLLFVLAAVGGGEGSIYRKLHDFHLGVWGFSAYVFPIITIIFAYFLSRNKEGDKPWGAYFWSCLLVTILAAMIHIIGCDTFDSLSFGEQIAYEYANLNTMGGVLGAFFGGLLYLVCRSKAVCLILYGVLLFFVAILLSRTTLQRLVGFFGKPVKKVGEITTDAVQRWKASAAEEAESESREQEPLSPEDEELIRRRRSSFPFSRKADEKKTQESEPEKAPPEDDFIDFTRENSGRKAPLRKTPSRSFVMPEQKAADAASAEQTEEAAGDAFDNMFATVDAMEKASIAAEEAAPDEPPFVPDAPVTENANEEKIKLKDGEFDQAKEEVAAEIAETEEAAPPPPEYKLPPFECLNTPTGGRFTANREELKANADKLIAALNSFKVEAKVVDIVPGPSVTRYELQPAAGVKISKFTNLSDDLALHLAAPAGVRIEAPIPNKSAIGIEIPNRDRVSVFMRELIDCDEFIHAKSKLNVALGKDITGKGVYLDIAKMPHLLVAGTTGSGKSVCLNSMIISILYNAKPNEVKLLLIDPKTVEFSVYNGIPHLLVPVVNDARKAAGALGWAVTEMINRYKILNDNGTRDIFAYNALCDERPDLEKMPQIVIVIDELSDLMSVAPSEVEDSITRLAQMARAAGMHLVVATQRPSVDVITGLIKANIPSRIALSVSSQIDSRTILDASGAEKLLGNGDMLVAPVGRRKPVRVQGCFISDQEIKRVVDFVKTQQEGQYDDDIQQEIERQAVIEKKKGGDKSGSQVGSLDGNDDLMMRAIEFIVTNPESCSISALQRKLGMGFSKAGRLMDTLEEQGIVGPQEGSKGRKVLLSKAEWEQMKALSTEE